MCSDPITQNGHTFACRKCNECIAARKNDWVVRCMAEKATSAETLIIDLTYRNNPDDTISDGARAFRYADVQDFFRSLREAYYRKYNARQEIRYIIAGERGSKRDRVHWHCAIFADRPISTLGEWEDFYFRPIEAMKFRRMLHWNFWTHGHVYPKGDDQGAIEYALKYAVKDQFSEIKSRGTMRYSKSEAHAASMFRMSKQPPIGERWLIQKLDKLEQLRAVQPTLQMKVPGYSGFWWPKGRQRELIVNRFHEINQSIRSETGRDAPQWNALLSTVSDSEKDWEGLVYGPLEQEKTEFNEEGWKPYLETAQQQRSKAARYASIRRNCGAPLLCRKCWVGSDPQRRREIRSWYTLQKEQHALHEYKGISFESWFRGQKRINPFCWLRPDHQKAFDA